MIAGDQLVGSQTLKGRQLRGGITAVRWRSAGSQSNSSDKPQSGQIERPDGPSNDCECPLRSCNSRPHPRPSAVPANGPWATNGRGPSTSRGEPTRGTHLPGAAPSTWLHLTDLYRSTGRPSRLACHPRSSNPLKATSLVTFNWMTTCVSVRFPTSGSYTRSSWPSAQRWAPLGRPTARFSASWPGVRRRITPSQWAINGREECQLLEGDRDVARREHQIVDRPLAAYPAWTSHSLPHIRRPT